MELIVLVSIAQRSAQFLILADDVADVAVVQGNVVGYEVGARVVQLEVGGRPAYWSIIPIVVAEGVAGYAAGRHAAGGSVLTHIAIGNQRAAVNPVFEFLVFEEDGFIQRGVGILLPYFHNASLFVVERIAVERAVALPPVLRGDHPADFIVPELGAVGVRGNLRDHLVERVVAVGGLEGMRGRRPAGAESASVTKYPSVFAAYLGGMVRTRLPA